MSDTNTRTEIRWVIYVARPAGTITAPDRKAAEIVAQRQWGSDIVRIQSHASLEVERQEAAAKARARRLESGRA